MKTKERLQKRIKRIGALILALILALVLLIPAVQSSAASTATLTVGNAVGQIGETVELQVSISNNTGFDIAAPGFTYDPNCLEPADDFINVNMSHKGDSVMYNTMYDTATPVISFSLISLNTVTDNGVLCTVRFKIIGAPPEGTTAVSLVSWGGQHILSKDYGAVNVGLVSGTVTVGKPVTGITVSPKTLDLKVGKTGAVTAAVQPADAAVTDVIWQSSDTAVATVSNGLVRGISAGHAVITAKTVDGGFEAQCAVTVTEDTGSIGGGGGTAVTPQAATPVASPPSGVITPGQKITLTCATPDAVIRYTLDGTDPGTSSLLYTAPIDIDCCVTMKVIAFAKGYDPSEILKASYVVNRFKDLTGYDWAVQPICILADQGIITGITPDTFGPGTPIRRADYILLLSRLMKIDDPFDNNFDDVLPESYYYSAVGSAKARGIAQGVGNNLFAPEKPITRQDLFALAYRICKDSGTIKEDAPLTALDTCKDQHAISDYARQPIATLVSLGLVQGDDSSNVRPTDTATRAEAAVFIYRLYVLINEP